MTENYTLHSFTYSRKAEANQIDNTPSEAVQRTLEFTGASVERVNQVLGHVVRILSGYRCEALNTLVKGSKSSQHMRGEAADIDCPKFGDAKAVALALRPYVKIIGIDQMILEGTWVHLSFSVNPRYQILTFKNGSYLKGIV